MGKMKKQPHLGPKCPRIPLALDSGAHSIYNQYFTARDKDGKVITGQKNIDLADYSFYKSEGFRTYLERYIEYLKAVPKDQYEFVVTLDVIFNPEASWEVYKEMRGHGLNVLPVYHFGEDVKWLKKYMGETDYIGIGGLGQQTTKASWLPFGERTWRTITDDKGRPLVKTHGFAVSSFDFLARWPWYSVDSTTAFTFSRMGAILLPQFTGRKEDPYNFFVTPTVVPVTAGRATHYRHALHSHPTGDILKAINGFLGQIGITLQDTVEAYMPRDTVNLHFFNRTMRALSERHSRRLGMKVSTRYYASGSPAANMDAFLATLDYLGERNDIDHLGYLGTFYKHHKYPITYLLKHWYGEHAE